jgi:NTP pyrophosphatase (non-canonical NTP hydrolase)
VNRTLLPTTISGKLDRLQEECAEVIKAVSKGRRFGWDPSSFDGVPYDNWQQLMDEMDDLDHALSQVRLIRFSIKDKL